MSLTLHHRSQGWPSECKSFGKTRNPVGHASSLCVGYQSMLRSPVFRVTTIRTNPKSFLCDWTLWKDGSPSTSYTRPLATIHRRVRLFTRKYRTVVDHKFDSSSCILSPLPGGPLVFGRPIFRCPRLHSLDLARLASYMLLWRPALPSSLAPKISSFTLPYT